MRTILQLLVLSLVLLACVSKTNEKKSLSDSSIIDSSHTIHTGMKSFPYEISDSTTQDSVDFSVAFLKNNILPLGDRIEGLWTIQKFLEIDSLKSSGKYQQYVAKLDIGETKESISRIYDTLYFPFGGAYLWGIEFQSFEACPYYNGKYIYLSTITPNGKHLSTKKILEISGGGDAPSFGYQKGTCIIQQEGTILCKDTSVTGEHMDDGYEELVITPGSDLYTITPEGFIILTQHKKETEIKKRKKDSNE